MRCVACKNLSLPIICNKCQKRFLQQNRSIRVLENGFKIYSFYKYSEIETLLKTKHTFIGSSIYKILAQNSFKLFSQEFNLPITVYAIAIDDHSKSGYSHTAILTKELMSKSIKPVYASLRAANHVTYSAKSLDYRLKNPRNFVYTFKENIDAILVDDIVTTGTTIKEAKKVLNDKGINVLFALTLADAREK